VVCSSGRVVSTPGYLRGWSGPTENEMPCSTVVVVAGADARVAVARGVVAGIGGWIGVGAAHAANKPNAKAASIDRIDVFIASPFIGLAEDISLEQRTHRKNLIPGPNVQA
jgi:hypothetical protein